MAALLLPSNHEHIRPIDDQVDCISAGSALGSFRMMKSSGFIDDIILLPTTVYDNPTMRCFDMTKSIFIHFILWENFGTQQKTGGLFSRTCIPNIESYSKFYQSNPTVLDSGHVSKGHLFKRAKSGGPLYIGPKGQTRNGVKSGCLGVWVSGYLGNVCDKLLSNFGLKKSSETKDRNQPKKVQSSSIKQNCIGRMCGMLAKKAGLATQWTKAHPYMAAAGACGAIGGMCTAIGSGITLASAPTAANVLSTIGGGMGTIGSTCASCIGIQHWQEKEAHLTDKEQMEPILKAKQKAKGIVKPHLHPEFASAQIRNLWEQAQNRWNE